MEGELEANTVEPEAPTIDPPAEEQPIDLEALREEENAPPEEEAETAPILEDDTEEFEWDGKLVKGPKGLKDGVLRQADYTRKTQEAAEIKRALEAEKQSVAQQAAANEEELEIRAAMHSIKAELARYANVNWEQWEQEAFVDAAAGFRRFQQLKEGLQTAENELKSRAEHRTQQTQTERSKRLEETRKFAETELKGWTPEVDAKVTEFATKTLGFDRDTLLDAYNPQVYHALYLAHLGHQLLTKPASPAKPVPPPAPLTVVASKANPPARKSMYDPNLPMDDFAEMLKSKLARR